MVENMRESDWKGTDRSYWDDRASKEYLYKNEKFYTITPVPYYYARRNIVINKIKEIIADNNFRNICDFGCGDGEYIRKLYNEKMMFHGVDASASMIQIARKALPITNVSFEVSENGITKNSNFDMVYSSAVWAHIDDNSCQDLIQNIYAHLRVGGIFVICEQMAPFRYGGVLRQTKN